MFEKIFHYYNMRNMRMIINMVSDLAISITLKVKGDHNVVTTCYMGFGFTWTS